MVAPFATGPTTIEVEGTLNEQPFVELTVNMMRDFGLEVGVADDWRRFEIEGNQTARPADVTLPPDIGSLPFRPPPPPRRPPAPRHRLARLRPRRDLDPPLRRLLPRRPRDRRRQGRPPGGAFPRRRR